MVGARRQLTTRESRAILEKLKRQVLPTDILERHLIVEQAISGNPLVVGNRATLLIDGPATYAAMVDAIRNASHDINFETFIFADDETGKSFSDLLLAKRAEGVRVNLIYDSLGSFRTAGSFFENLRDGGVNVLAFNPINPVIPIPILGRWPFTHRDHRKILVVDGNVAFTGGVNVSSVYSKSSSAKVFGSAGKREGKLSWRDTDVQIEGPAVAEFQNLFLDTWRRQGGDELDSSHFFPQPKQEGNELVRVIGSRKGQRNRATYMANLSAITFASDSIHLTNGYFIPDRRTIRALTEAAERGVDVKIILPARSDWAVTYYAGRFHYSRLLRAGVKLYERRSAVLHAKTAVIDGVWSSVGSTNMDLWSFLRNDEVNAVILGRDFAGQMEDMFQRDLDDSDAISLDKWECRSLGERLKEVLSRSLGYWL